MQTTHFGGAIALSLIFAACGETQTLATENQLLPEADQAPAQAGQVHSGSGKVQAIAGDQVTIAHGSIESIGWPAMTKTFSSPTGLPPGVQAGTQVNFSFRQDNGAYALKSVQPR